MRVVPGVAASFDMSFVTLGLTGPTGQRDSPTADTFVLVDVAFRAMLARSLASRSLQWTH